MATTTVINVAQTSRVANTYTFDAPSAVASGVRFATFRIPIDLVDKLAAAGTKTIVISFLFSPDGVAPYVFANGTTWKSYGPGGFIRHNVDGTTTTNPDPEIQLPLLTRAGQRLRGSFVLNSTFNAGVVVTITT